ncbi:hypothetical protein CMUS01_02605 [Colletotrichum musicola]|uniref:Myb-like domain-containing protein n=1 Tax=Colletotrichum musicola TaxID=2175873 RepID=A0A8H6NV31_9PEZI|nr:hypothetical protein CMUS01_02605 [Colletotrichum musicola]
MNKNWNDRADKDLFFTILSVKNIGVISGSEWTTIGNYMRSMGYGFTNEGCRQHFQGLRRAQQKADSNGGGSDNPRNVDPTLNPITRRPGPGRGRPKKQQQQQPGPIGLPPLPVQGPQPDLPQLHDQAAQAHAHETHHGHHVLHAHEAAQAAQAQAHAHETHPAHQAVQDGQAVQASQAGQNPQSDQAPQIPEIPRDPQEPQGPQGPHDPPPVQPDQTATQPAQPPSPPAGVADGLHDLSESLDIPLKGDPLDISLKDDENDDSDEHAAKRIKLDDATQDQSIDDEAVLALAAHSNSSSVDAYASEYPTAGLSGSDPHAFPYEA